MRDNVWNEKKSNYLCGICYVSGVEVIETGNIVSESKKREENACDGSVIKLSVTRETSDRMAETHAPRSSGNEFQPK